MDNYFSHYLKRIRNLFKLKETKQPIPSKKILKKTLDYSSGLEYQLENPDSLLTNKGKDLTFYDTMMLDDKIKGTIELKKKMCLAVPWSIKPGTDEDSDQEIADEIKRQFDTLATSTVNPRYSKIQFNNVLDNLLDSMIYGFKIGEKRFVLENGFIALKNVHFMHSIFYDFGYDEWGEWDKLRIGYRYGETTEIKGQEMFDKFLIMVWPYIKDGNMYGDSDLREVYTQYYAKQYIYKFRNIFLQNFGMPLPEVIYDTEATDASEINDMENMLKNLQENLFILQPGVRRDEDGELQGKFTIKIHEFNPKATDQYEKAIDQIDKQIARKLLLPDKVGFSESAGGSYNMAEIQFDALLMVIQDIHHKLESVINPMIEQIVDYNWSVKEYPTFRFDDITNKVPRELLKILIDTNIVDPAEPWIRERVGIPELTEKEKEMIEEEKKKRIEQQRQMFPGKAEEGKEDKEKKSKFDDNIKDRENDIGKMAKSKRPFDADKVRKTMDENEADFKKEYEKIYKSNIMNIVKQVQKKKIIENKDLKEARNLKIQKTELRELFKEYMTKMYVIGKQQAIEEIQDRLPREVQMQAGEHPEKWLNRSWVKSYLDKYGELGKLTKADVKALQNIAEESYFITGVTEKDMLEDTFFILDNGIKTGEPLSVAIGQIRERLDANLEKYATTVARTNTARFYNDGRMNLFTSPDISPMIEAYQYSAILDDVTTLFCESHDGQIIKQGDPELTYASPPNHFNCRSELLPIMIEEKNQDKSYYYDYENNEKMPEWGSNRNSESYKTGKTFNMNDPEIRKPSIGFGG